MACLNKLALRISLLNIIHFSLARYYADTENSIFKRLLNTKEGLFFLDIYKLDFPNLSPPYSVLHKLLPLQGFTTRNEC